MDSSPIIPKTNDPVQREALFFAVGSFRAQQIAEQARGIVLSDAYDTRESLTILLGDPSNPDTPWRRFDFIRRNYEKLLARLPSGGPVDSGALLPGLAGGLCSQSAKEMFQNSSVHGCSSSTGGLSPSHRPWRRSRFLIRKWSDTGRTWNNSRGSPTNPRGTHCGTDTCGWRIESIYVMKTKFLCDRKFRIAGVSNNPPTYDARTFTLRTNSNRSSVAATGCIRMKQHPARACVNYFSPAFHSLCTLVCCRAWKQFVL